MINVPSKDLTVKETAERLGCTYRSIQNYLNRKKSPLKCYKVGGIIRIKPEWIEEFIKGGKNEKSS